MDAPELVLHLPVRGGVPTAVIRADFENWADDVRVPVHDVVVAIGGRDTPIRGIRCRINRARTGNVSSGCQLVIIAVCRAGGIGSAGEIGAGDPDRVRPVWIRRVSHGHRTSYIWRR